jgi:hypothetical protein
MTDKPIPQVYESAGVRQFQEREGSRSFSSGFWPGKVSKCFVARQKNDKFLPLPSFIYNQVVHKPQLVIFI